MRREPLIYYADGSVDRPPSREALGALQAFARMMAEMEERILFLEERVLFLEAMATPGEPVKAVVANEVAEAPCFLCGGSGRNPDDKRKKCAACRS